MKHILVTGGAGYIGSHVCKALAQAGYVPVAFDNLSRGHEWAVRWGPLERGDINDAERVTEVIRQYSPVATMHFAAYAYVGESMSQPSLYYGNNVSATWRLLETLRSCDMRQFIFSSTCAVYGGMHREPIAEDAPLTPASTYGRTKLMIEHMLLDYARAYDFSSISLRYFNAAGADPNLEIGEAHDPEPHFIPNILKVAAGEQSHLKINGDQHPTPDGSCVRDFIHVSDIADAHILALDALLNFGIRGEFNLGNGQGFSLKRIVDIACQVTGRAIPYEIGAALPGDPPFAVGNSARARRVLGWTPRIPQIEDIISSSWQWHQIAEDRRRK